MAILEAQFIDRRTLRETLRYGGPAVLASLALAACGSSDKNVSATESSAGPTSPAHAARTFHAPSRKTYDEISDNHLGVAVFASPEGASVPDNTPQRIPYAEHVKVGCVAPNLSGMSSVNEFYLIVSGKWRGMFGVANSFANGGPMGPNSNNIDPNVPKCEPG